MQLQSKTSRPFRPSTPTRAAYALLFIGALTSAVQATTGLEDPLPKAADLLDKHVQATGGKKAHLAIKSRTRTGTLEVKMSGHDFVAKVHEQYLAPNMSHLNIDGDFFFQVNVCDGVNAWEWRPAFDHGKKADQHESGATTLKLGKDRSTAIENSNFHAAVNWRDRVESLETVRIVDVKGSPAYEVAVTTKSAREYSQFFDVKSGRLVKRSEVQSTGMGPMRTESFYSDYRQIDGVWLAMKRMVEVDSPDAGKGTQSWTFDKIDHKKKISPALFKMPEELQEEANALKAKAAASQGNKGHARVSK
jgi:hypothetical protein